MADKYDILKLKNQMCFPLYLCSKEIIRKYEPFLKELDLTYTQYLVMMYFWEMESSNLKELAKTLMIDPSTLTPLLKKLEKKGYIRRVRSKEDERNLVITLTENGKALKDDALTVPENLKKCVSLSEEETKTLYTLLRKILNDVN